jgi:tetratricopeptide (TPR) repeat protein
MYQELGDSTAALQNFKMAIEIDPNFALAYFNAANLYLDQKRWEQAEEYYNKALQNSKGDVYSLINRSICKILKNDKAGALADLDLAIEINPNSPEARFNRAALLQSLEKFSEAEKEFSQVLELHPDDKTAHLMRGQARGAQSEWKNAMDDYLDFVRYS